MLTHIKLCKRNKRNWYVTKLFEMAVLFLNLKNKQEGFFFWQCKPVAYIKKQPHNFCEAMHIYSEFVYKLLTVVTEVTVAFVGISWPIT